MQKRRTHTAYGDAVQCGLSDACKAQTRKRQRNLSKQNKCNRQTEYVFVFLIFIERFFHSKTTAVSIHLSIFCEYIFVLSITSSRLKIIVNISYKQKCPKLERKRFNCVEFPLLASIQCMVEHCTV